MMNLAYYNNACYFGKRYKCRKHKTCDFCAIIREKTIGTNIRSRVDEQLDAVCCHLVLTWNGPESYARQLAHKMIKAASDLRERAAWRTLGIIGGIRKIEWSKSSKPGYVVAHVHLFIQCRMMPTTDQVDELEYAWLRLGGGNFASNNDGGKFNIIDSAEYLKHASDYQGKPSIPLDHPHRQYLIEATSGLHTIRAFGEWHGKPIVRKPKPKPKPQGMPLPIHAFTENDIHDADLADLDTIHNHRAISPMFALHKSLNYAYDQHAHQQHLANLRQRRYLSERQHRQIWFDALPISQQMLFQSAFDPIPIADLRPF